MSWVMSWHRPEAVSSMALAWRSTKDGAVLQSPDRTGRADDAPCWTRDQQRSGAALWRAVEGKPDDPERVKRAPCQTPLARRRFGSADSRQACPLAPNL